jgi:hypothetical protein
MMSVAILIEFKEHGRKDLYLPVATEGEYGREWVENAEKLGLRWLPLFQAGTSVAAEELSAVVKEIQQLRTKLAGDPKKAATLERIDFILESLGELSPEEISRVFIG